MFCCTLLYVHSSIAIILMGKRELIALLNLSSWCLVMVERLFLAVPRGCLQFVIVVFPDHTHLLFLTLVLIFVLFMSCVCHVFASALWSPAGKGLSFWLLFVISNGDFCHFPLWYPGSGVVREGVVLICIDS